MATHITAVLARTTKSSRMNSQPVLLLETHPKKSRDYVGKVLVSIYMMKN